MVTLNKDTAASNRKEGFTLALAKQMYSNQSWERSSDLALMRQYYHPDVRFRDAIQEVHGRDALIETTQNFLTRCKEFDVQLHDAAQAENVIFLEWTMKMRLGRAPLTTIEGTTKLTLDAEGKVTEHRDYFDLWGDTLGSLPGIGNAYRRAVKLLA